MDDEVLAVVQASTARRWLGMAMLAVIGGLSLYVAFAAPPEPVWQAFLIAIGALALWMAERMRRATEKTIELTEREVRERDGPVIAQVDDIQSIDRGFLAFKPSNGFLIRTRSRGARSWQPGLWWRMGRRIGIGGVAPGYQTRIMSDILAAMLAKRNGKGAA